MAESKLVWSLPLATAIRTLCARKQKMETFSLCSDTWFALKACYCGCAIELRRFYPVMDLIKRLGSEPQKRWSAAGPSCGETPALQSGPQPGVCGTFPSTSALLCNVLSLDGDNECNVHATQAFGIVTFILKGKFRSIDVSKSKHPWFGK